MTDAELEELGALLAKATPGDWKLQHNGYGLSVYAFTGAIALGAADPHDSDNLALVAAMKRALPSLISTIRELREENAQTKLGYDADIKALCEALWKREPGCEFVRLNYPQIAAAFEEQS